MTLREKLMKRMPSREKIQELIDRRKAAIAANSGHDPWLDDKYDEAPPSPDAAKGEK